MSQVKIHTKQAGIITDFMRWFTMMTSPLHLSIFVQIFQRRLKQKIKSMIADNPISNQIHNFVVSQQKLIAQQQQTASFYRHLIEKLEEVLNSLQQELSEMQAKHSEELSKMVKQMEQKDKLILSLTKINNGLMKDNARIKKKSDSQFQYFVKRIAETECSALNEKKQLDEVVSEWEKTLSRISSKKYKEHEFAKTAQKMRSSLNPQIHMQRNIEYTPTSHAESVVPGYDQETENKPMPRSHNRLDRASKKEPLANQKYSRMLSSTPAQMQTVNQVLQY